jgi:hypothetical protein
VKTIVESSVKVKFAYVLKTYSGILHTDYEHAQTFLSYLKIHNSFCNNWLRDIKVQLL